MCRPVVYICISSLERTRTYTHTPDKPAWRLPRAEDKLEAAQRGGGVGGGVAVDLVGGDGEARVVHLQGVEEVLCVCVGGVVG